MIQQSNKFTDTPADSGADETPDQSNQEPQESPFDPTTWDWSSNEAPPAPFWALDDVFPSEPWSGTGDFPGHWEWILVTDPESGEPVGRWPGWYYDELPSETEIKAQLAREQLAASVALQADLDASIAELADSVALLDPAAMRQPAKGFDAFGFTVIGEAEINRTNASIANVAEAIQKSMAAFQANAAANAKTIEATNAVLEAVPVNAAMLAAPAE